MSGLYAHICKKGISIIEGDMELLPYVDIVGYFFKKKPLKRFNEGVNE